MAYGAMLLALLAGCSSGGGGGDDAADTDADIQSGARGVPVTLSATSEGTTAALAGGTTDEYLAVFTNPTADATVRVTVNGGGSLLANLPDPDGRKRGTRSRAADATASFAFLGSFANGIDARLAHAGDETLLYIDEQTPDEALTADDLADLGEQLETFVLPFVKETLGDPSDIDQNGTVTILMTPLVEPPHYGYFYLGDISGFGNDADLIYTRVPEPSAGEPYSVLRSALLATLVHEMQHLINYHYKAVIAGLGGEQSWLNEGLSFLTEDLAGLLDTAGGSPENVAEFFAGPEWYTLRETSGSYDDGHAGAAYLFCRYLADRFGEDLVRALVTNDVTGVTNVAEATGQSFADLYCDWAAALYLNGTELNASSRYKIPGFDTRDATYLNGTVSIDGPQATEVSAASGRPRFSLDLVRGGLRFVRLISPADRGTVLSVRAPDAAGVRVVLIRLPADS